VKLINTKKSPQPNGHYSQAVVHSNTVYTAVQLGIAPDESDPVPGTIEEQTKQVLQNIEEIINHAGSDKYHVLKVTIYISDMKFWDEINSVYQSFFGNHKPARGVVAVANLHLGFNVAMDAIAAVKE
jgi:2-iminobutanoate/2-iminopropanoate deaminase